jgi:hypothetical protein
MNMKYYTMADTGEKPRRWIDHYDYYPYMEYIQFNVGRKIPDGVKRIPDDVKGPPDPLVCFLQPLEPNADYSGPEMPEIFEGTVPLFRDDFIAALKESGVDNIDYYNVVITDPDNGREYTNYKAANIIVSETYIEASHKLEYVVKHNLPIARWDVYIIVREDLKEQLLKKGFPFLKFDDVDDVPETVWYYHGEDDLDIAAWRDSGDDSGLDLESLNPRRVMVWGIIIKDPAKNREAVNGVLDEFKEQLALQSDIPFPKENVSALALIFTGTNRQVWRMKRELNALNVSIHNYAKFPGL